MKRDLDWLRRQVDLVAIARPHLEGLKFEAGEHKALCPFHKERTPSFTLYVDNGVQRYKCFGCSAGGDVFDFLMAAERLTRLEAIERVEELAGAGIAAAPPEPKARSEKRGPWKDPDYGRIVATYDYTDAASRLLYQVLRVQPGRNGRDKEFPQRVPDGKGGFVFGLQGQANVLYRWPALLRASEVWVCEGEKDVHSLEAAGRVATTNSGGAAQWQKPRPDLADVLKDKTVYVVPDNDANGKKRGGQIIADLRTRAAKLYLVKLPEFVKDVTEFIESGQSVDDMVAIAKEVPTERPKPEPAHEPAHEYDDRGSQTNVDWRSLLLLSRDGFTPLPILANALIALRGAPEWAGAFALNDFSVAVYSRRKNPAIKRDGDHPWTDAADARLCDWLQHEAIRVSPEVAGRAVLTVADEHRYHPVRDYLQALKWDGDPRLDNWLIEYLGVEPSHYAAAVGRRWMISAVARIMEPGCKVDTCLILEGRQGLKKSTALRTLGEPWFTDQISDLGTKDSKQEIRGVWIIEIAELAAMKSFAEVSKVKAFMTSQRDRFRAPYARHVAEHGRQCVFAGSVNDSQYLRDDTGGRRWWPVACTRIDIDRLQEDKDQLWAEAVVRYQEGCPWYLDSQALDAEAEAQQEQRREADPWQHLVEEHLRHNRHVEQWTPEEILQMAIEKRKAEWTKFDRDRVVRILRAMGYELARPRLADGRRARCYVKADNERDSLDITLM